MLSNLPVEIISEIYHWLDYSGQRNLALNCRYLYSVYRTLLVKKIKPEKICADSRGGIFHTLFGYHNCDSHIPGDKYDHRKYPFLERSNPVNARGFQLILPPPDKSREYFNKKESNKRMKTQLINKNVLSRMNNRRY